MVSEALTQAFEKATSDYLVVMNEDGLVQYANPAFLRALLPGGEAKGKPLISLLDEESATRAELAMSKTGRGCQQVELNHALGDGKAHPVLYNLCRVAGGVVGIGRDKTADLKLMGKIVKLNMQLEEKQAKLAEANARLEQLAITDHVTGLYNRHHFFSITEHLFEEAVRYKLPLCCFMIDADHFKDVNDTLGHIFGDYVLKMIADRFRQLTRRCDVLARYGGEEFVMVAPNTDLETAQVLAERLRAAIDREPIVLGNTSRHVTVSVGVSGTELIPKGPFEELLHTADQAMYVVKQRGRNGCCIFSPKKD